MRFRHYSLILGVTGVVTAAAVAGCGNDSTAPADVLAIAQVLNSGGGAVVADHIIFRLTVSDTVGQDTVFASSLQNGARGSAVVANSGTPGFQRAAQLLTDGVNESVLRGVYFPTGGGGSVSSNESVYFVGRPGNSFDFVGYEITSLVFHVDSISLLTPGSNPNGNGIWTDYYLRGSLVVLGHLK